MALCVFVCLNLQALAWLMDGPLVQAPQYRCSIIVHKVLQMVPLSLSSSLSPSMVLGHTMGIAMGPHILKPNL